MKTEPTPCPGGTDYAGNANGTNYFIGVTMLSGDGGTNYATANATGVLAGAQNTACGYGSAVMSGIDNNAAGTNSAISSGEDNSTSSGATASWIGAGFENNASGQQDALIVGGQNNGEIGSDSLIGAGIQNLVYSDDSFLGAGQNNSLSGLDSFIGAGDQNAISANYSTIDGGVQNKVNGSNGYTTIGGGLGNQASGKYAVIPGGYRNEANGELSFAAGYQAEAVNTGSFVWSDYVGKASPLTDTAADQFVVRSSGGVYFYSNEGDTAGVSLAPGAGMWESLSDRNSKTDVNSLNDASILAKLVALPVSTWQYRSEKGVRHVGPMAQGFYAAFGVGEDDHHLNAIDEDGIAYSAIKALHRENAILRASILADHAELAQLKSELEHIESRPPSRHADSLRSAWK